jgi:hypothetical protein
LKIQPQWVVTPGKQTNKEHGKVLSILREDANYVMRQTYRIIVQHKNDSQITGFYVTLAIYSSYREMN